MNDKAIEEALVNLIPPVSVVPEYRIYYDEFGNITACAMVQHPPGENYIIVSVEQYHNYWRYRVKNGKLEPIKIDASSTNILRKSDKGFKVVKGHANLLLDDKEHFENVEFYAYR